MPTVQPRDAARVCGSERCAILLMLLLAAGCAIQPSTPEEQISAWLSEAPRKLVVRVERKLPQLGIPRSIDTRFGERVGTGAGQAAYGAAYTIVEFCRGGLAGCTLGVMAAPFVALGGAIAGAARVDSVDSTHPILFELKGKKLDIPGLLEESIVAQALAAGGQVVAAPGNAQGESLSEPDGELTLHFHAFELLGGDGPDPSVSLALRIRAEMRTPAAASRGWRDFSYEGSAHPISQWQADNARLLQTEILVAVREIAARLATQLGSSAPSIAVSAAGAPAISAAALAFAQGALPQPGATWDYTYTQVGVASRRFDYTVRATRVDGSTVQELLAVPGRPAMVDALSQEQSEFRTVSVPGASPLVEFSPYFLASGTFREGAPLLQPLLQIAGYPTGTTPHLAWKYDARYAGWEDVVTPAGKFRALQVQITGNRSRTLYEPFVSNTGRFVYRLWYSPEVRRYVRIQHETWSMSDKPYGSEIVVLVKYTSP